MRIETGPEGWDDTTFAVAHRPGDNHRVAASLKQVALASVTHENVPPSRMETGQQATEDQAPLFIGNISPLLTVWRRLHVEIDAMFPETPTLVARAPDRCTVVGLSATPTVSTGTTRLELAGPVGDMDIEHYEGGTLEILGPEFSDILSLLAVWYNSLALGWGHPSNNPD